MHWNITVVKPAYYLKLFWSMWCPKISSSRSLHKGVGLHAAKNEEIDGTVPYQKLFMSCYSTFKKKSSTCGSQVDHMWVTSGLFRGLVGQIGHQVWPTFNPALNIVISLWPWHDPCTGSLIGAYNKEVAIHSVLLWLDTKSAWYLETT